MAKTKIKINAAIEGRDGELKTGVVLEVNIFAKDLSPDAHDVVGYKGLAYAGEAAATSEEEPIRLKKLHESASKNPRAFRFDFEGEYTSANLPAYDVEMNEVSKGVKKVEPTAACADEIVAKIIADKAAELSIQVSDFEVLA